MWPFVLKHVFSFHNGLHQDSFLVPNFVKMKSSSKLAKFLQRTVCTDTLLIRKFERLGQCCCSDTAPRSWSLWELIDQKSGTYRVLCSPEAFTKDPKGVPMSYRRLVNVERLFLTQNRKFYFTCYLGKSNSVDSSQNRSVFAAKVEKWSQENGCNFVCLFVRHFVALFILFIIKVTKLS